MGVAWHGKLLNFFGNCDFIRCHPSIFFSHSLPENRANSLHLEGNCSRWFTISPLNREEDKSNTTNNNSTSSSARLAFLPLQLFVVDLQSSATAAATADWMPAEYEQQQQQQQCVLIARDQDGQEDRRRVHLHVRNTKQQRIRFGSAHYDRTVQV